MTTGTLILCAAAVAAELPVCNVAVCPERESDCVWENDRFGMRAYGPGEYHKWSGFDVFNKGKGAGSAVWMMHHPKDCGHWHDTPWRGVLDNYTMGPSRGVGGLAMFADGEWKTYPDWESFREIHTGDDFCEFEIVYPAFSAAGRMTCHITLARGERFFRNDVSFERMPKGFVVGPGLDLEPKRDHRGDLATDEGLVSLFEDPKGANGSTMAAVFVFPGEKVETLTDPNNCRVFGFRGRTNFTYWAGASWSEAGEIATPAAWHAEVRRYRSSLVDPLAVNRRITEQFLSTCPDRYAPFGVSVPYGWGKYVFYATASLWVNALDNARAFGEKDLEKRLVAAFEPYLGEKVNMLRGVKHVDFNVVGAVPLAIARLTGDARAREHGLRLADFQWREPKADDEVFAAYATFEERLAWWKKGYSDETRLWIDDMYMINLLQTQAYRLTGERKYVDRAAREMCLYLERLQLKNGLFYHAPDVPFVWGRGAGWMAAGMPLVLACLDESHPNYAQILAGYRRMMAALLRYQRADGLWGQLVDEPDSWAETSGSAMFAFALASGVRHGWLEAAKVRPAVDRAWRSLCARLDAHANISGVCIGTNKKADHQYYLDRARINGDPHGQAAMLWLAGELAEKPAPSVSPAVRQAALKMAGYDYSNAERHQLIEPVTAGGLRIEPLFRTAGVTAGFPRSPRVFFEYRPSGTDGAWRRPAVAPVHFPEQDNWRGMLFDLDENAGYDFRAVTETGKILAERKFRTWASEVPIAETVYLDENVKFPIVISGKGRPDGWIRYTTKPGVTLVNSNEEFYTDYHGPVNVVGAEYVVLDDMKIVAGHCRRAVILMYSHDVRVRNCEITGFGVDVTPDVGVYGGSALARPRAAHGEPIRDPVTTGILVYRGMRNTVIERCWIHDPINRSCAWRYWHPFGPVGAVFAMPDHSTVFRYNDVTGSDLKPFDDGISEWGNAGPNAGLNRTAELYGNFFIFAQDDSVEIDGAQQNVAVFDNRFETALVGLSLQGNSVSPSYAFRNLFASMGDEFGEYGQTIKTAQFDCYGVGVYSAAWKNLLWGGGSGVNVGFVSPKTSAKYRGDAAGRIARFDVFDNTFCGRQTICGTDAALHSDLHGNRFNAKVAARDLPTDLPARPLSFTLDAARIDVRDPSDRAPRKLRVTGGRGERFRIAKNDGQDWFSVTPSEGVLRDGLELSVTFDPSKLTGRPIFRSAFAVRLDNGLSRPVSVYVAASYRQPERCEKPGVTAVYARAGDCTKDSEGFDVYALAAPRDGRYYLMAFAQAPELPLFRARLNGEKTGYAALQTCPDYPVWSIVSPNSGFDTDRWRWRGRVKGLDLKSGEKVTLRLKPYRGTCDLKALVLTDDAGAFEPRMCRTRSTDLDWIE